MGGVPGGVASLDGLQFTCRLLGVSVRSCVIQASTNLQTWTDLTTNVAADGSVSITNALNGTFHHRFFRLQSGPQVREGEALPDPYFFWRRDEAPGCTLPILPGGGRNAAVFAR